MLNVRYKCCWLPLLAKHAKFHVTEGPLVVPLDCEWIWHCHRLNPVGFWIKTHNMIWNCLHFSMLGLSSHVYWFFRCATRMIARNFMGEFLITGMLHPLFKELAKSKLKKFGIGCLRVNHMNPIGGASWQRILMQLFWELQKAPSMI